MFYFLFPDAKRTKTKDFLLGNNKSSQYYPVQMSIRIHILNLIDIYNDQIIEHINKITKEEFDYQYNFQKDDLWLIFQGFFKFNGFAAHWDNQEMIWIVIDFLSFLFRQPLVFFKVVDLNNLPPIIKDTFLFDLIIWIKYLYIEVINNNKLDESQTIVRINKYAPKSIKINDDSNISVIHLKYL